MIDETQIKLDSEHDFYPFHYKGLRTEQQPQYIFKALDALAKKIKKDPAKQIIEIGSRQGGFTQILNDHTISDSAKIYAWDVGAPLINLEKAKRVETVVGNCFADEGKIGEIITREGRTIVFCDGGNKNLEFNIFAKYLKPGDIILAHDYAPNNDIFQDKINKKIWDWIESWDDALKPAVEKYGLKPLLKKEFNAAVWCCMIKE